MPDRRQEKWKFNLRNVQWAGFFFFFSHCERELIPVALLVFEDANFKRDHGDLSFPSMWDTVRAGR